MTHRAPSLLALLGLLVAPTANAGSSASGEEYMAVNEVVEPNVLFLIDLSSAMDEACDDEDDEDTGGSDSGSTDSGGASFTSGSSSATSGSCLEDVLDAIDQVTQHFDWARFGVIGTSDESTYGDEYYPLVPLGTSYAELSAALDGIEANSTAKRNLGEALADATDNYFSATDTDDLVDDDGDGFDNDWDEAPIEYWCQENHVIVITRGRPENEGDRDVPAGHKDSISSDTKCDTAGITTGTDEDCQYDNVVYSLYADDVRSDLSDDQNIVVHTVGIGIDGSSISEQLFGNASDMIGGAGTYTVANTGDEVLSGILRIMADLRSGTYSRSTPVVSSEGNFLVYTFYELTGDSILAEGHIRAYEIDADPTSSTYGQVQYDDADCEDESYECGGALWDGGDLLVSRPVVTGETQPDDRDGFGKRDIYTFFEPAVSLTAVSSEASGDRRMGFDREFVSAVESDSTVLDLIIDTTVSSSAAPCGEDLAYDLSKDGCLVDGDDLQALVDFARGLDEAEFLYLDEQRGKWKLGDSPHSIPVIVEGRSGNYAIDPSYRKYLTQIEANSKSGESPDIVLVAANDGMLHAFQMEDDSTTGGTEQGEELWAWVPGYLLHRERDSEWTGSLRDLMLYGRTFLFDGSPVVEDVWIDADDDGEKDCTSVPDDCEWRRVVIVQQGKGGPVTLALDITDTNDPKFLWEQTDETDRTAMGYTVGRPVIANVYDASDTDNIRDRWIAIWGSGLAVPYSSSSNYYETAEANIYIWSIGDDYWGSTDVAYQDDGDKGYARGDNYHPEASLYSSAGTLEYDSDSEGHYEYAYISAAIAAVDADSDGDVDTLYFPVTSAYTPTDEGGSGPGDIADPGSSWMYKACINTSDPGDLTWIEFFDPIDDGGLSERPTVYYSATTSWLADGSLGVYWGTGTPYERTSSNEGYFFAMKDTYPADCSGDNMTPISDCGTDGIYTLESGEGLTSDPVVYAGVVYFSTWLPETDRCDGGFGRLYGLDFGDCGEGMDTNGDGVVDADDEDYTEVEDSYLSGVSVTDAGTLFYGMSDVDADGDDDIVGSIDTVSGQLGTATIAWQESF